MKRGIRTVRAREAQAILRRAGGDGWSELTRRFGRTFRLQGAVVSADPEVARTLLMHRPHVERRAGPYKLMDRIIPGGPGILFKEGEEWVRRLRVLMPTFAPTRIDALGAEIAETAAEHTAVWRHGAMGHDLMEEVSTLGTRIVLKVGYNLDPDHPTATALGRELRGYKFETMRPGPHRLDELGVSARLLLQLPAIARGLMGLRGRMKRIGRLVEQLLRDPPILYPARRGWLEVLRDDGFGLADLTDELNHLYGAYNAVDYVTTCALVELDRNPEWRERVRDELTEVLCDRTDLSRADFPLLPLTRAFVQEVLRRYPVAMVVFREVGEPMEVEGEMLAAGTQLMLPLHSLHHDRDLWGDPDVFRPERFLEGGPAERFSFLPFLRGPRKCIGQDLAELQILAVLNALRDWRVRLRAGDARVNHYIIPRWDRPLPFHLERQPARVRAA